MDYILGDTMTQNAEILAYLEAGGGLTPQLALSLFGSFRLGARIWDLRKAGNEIVEERVPVLNRYGKVVYVSLYRLKPSEPVA